MPSVSSYYLFYFWPCHMACGILVSQLGIEPVPPAVEARRLPTGPLGKFLKLLLKYYFFKCKFIYLQNFVIENHVILSYFSG